MGREEGRGAGEGGGDQGSSQPINVQVAALVWEDCSREGGGGPVCEGGEGRDVLDYFRNSSPQCIQLFYLYARLW